jgi:hypothetical protein
VVIHEDVSKRLGIVLVAVAIALLAIWGVSSHRHASTSTSTSTSTSDLPISGGPRPEARSPKIPQQSLVKISGHVREQADGSPIDNAEVVVRGAGQSTVHTRSDGAFAIEVAPGAYRVAVRAGGVLTVEQEDHERLDAGAAAALVGAPDDTLMPLVDATSDVANLELVLPRDATIAGWVTDRDGRRIAHAIVRARNDGNTRPAFGSDVAETDGNGNYTLRVAPGKYRLQAAAPGFAGTPIIEIVARARATATLALVLKRGCEIRGRVVRSDGAPSSDGAIERRAGDSDFSFGPAGRIEPDGTFRWTTLEDGEVWLRAWPWKSAPTEARSFECEDGARFGDVVLHTANRAPSLRGTISDATGAPVPFAFLDVEALDPMLPSQQERGDAEGRWEVYDLPPGRYQIKTAAAARGIAVTTVALPRDEVVSLQLAGTSRIEGATTALANGTIEITFDACFDALDLARRPMPIPHEPRLVAVTGGRFAIDEAPACDLLFTARWRDQKVATRVAVSPATTAHVELALGRLRDKTVRGVVRDREGNPLANVRVSAVFEGRDAAATTDDAGRYTLHSFAGAQLVASDGRRTGNATVGRANVSEEQVDVVLSND